MADLGAWLVFEDEPGQGLRPPAGRTWGRRGQTPVVAVTGGSDTRVSLAALIAVRAGCRPRLIYRVHRGPRSREERRKGFTEQDYARLPDQAHQQLGGPLVVVWDGLNTHISGVMADLVAARDWLTIFRFPPYAHELDPGGAGLGAAQEIAGQPGQTRHRPADRADQDPTQAAAVPVRPPRGLPRRHRTRLHANP